MDRLNVQDANLIRSIAKSEKMSVKQGSFAQEAMQVASINEASEGPFYVPMAELDDGLEQLCETPTIMNNNSLCSNQSAGDVGGIYETEETIPGNGENIGNSTENMSPGHYSRSQTDRILAAAREANMPECDKLISVVREKYSSP